MGNVVVWVDKFKDLPDAYIQFYELNYDYNFVLFDNFEESCAYVTEHVDEIDLVISNYSTMTVVDFCLNPDADVEENSGIGLFERIQKANKKTPFILYSSYVDLDFDSIQRLKEKFENFHFLEKKFDEQLKDKIDILLSSRRTLH